MGFPCGLASKESASNAGDLGLIPGLGRFPGEGKGLPTLASSLAWRIPWTLQSMGSQIWTSLSDFHFHFSCIYRKNVAVYTRFGAIHDVSGVQKRS